MSVFYLIAGSAADGQSWECKGDVARDFPDCMTDAVMASFQQLTQGKAVYGQPGVGCRGPYKIERIELTVAGVRSTSDMLASAECIIRQAARDTFGEDLTPQEFADRSSYDS